MFLLCDCPLCSYLLKYKRLLHLVKVNDVVLAADDE